MSKFNAERAAMILVDAAYLGDKPAAEKHCISERSIRNWRKKLDEDPEFSASFQLKKQAMEADWASELPTAIKAGIKYLKEAAENASRNDPDVIHAVAGGLKILTEARAMKDILDARLTRSD